MAYYLITFARFVNAKNSMPWGIMRFFARKCRGQKGCKAGAKMLYCFCAHVNVQQNACLMRF